MPSPRTSDLSDAIQSKSFNDISPLPRGTGLLLPELPMEKRNVALPPLKGLKKRERRNSRGRRYEPTNDSVASLNEENVPHEDNSIVLPGTIIESSPHLGEQKNSHRGSSTDGDEREQTLQTGQFGNAGDNNGDDADNDDNENSIQSTNNVDDDVGDDDEEDDDGANEERSETSIPQETTTKSSKLKRIAWKRFLRDLWAALSFNPSSKGRSIWDIVVFIAVLYNGFVVPLRACFLVYNVYWWITFDILTDLFLYVDILVKFFTEYDLNGYTVKDKRKMAIHYLRSWTFWIDVASVLPTEIIGYILNLYPWFRMNRLLKILTNETYFNSMENVLPNVSPAVFRLLKSVYFIVIAAHFLGSGYFFVLWLQGEDNISESFVPGAVPILELNIFQQYTRSYYWAFVLMTGYTNTQPKTDAESAYALIVIIIGLGLYVTIIGTVGSLVASLDASGSEFQAKMDQINAFMAYRKLPSHIQDMVRKYYNYLWKSRRSLNEISILEDLPIHLRTEVALCLHQDLIENVPWFRKVERQFIESIVLILQPRVALPNVYIIRKGEIGREMFFIAKGEVEVVAEDGITVYATFKSGQFFGEIALLYHTKRTASIRATTFCDLFVITKTDFDQLLQRFPSEEQIIREEAAKRKK